MVSISNSFHLPLPSNPPVEDSYPYDNNSIHHVEPLRSSKTNYPITSRVKTRGYRYFAPTAQKKYL